MFNCLVSGYGLSQDALKVGAFCFIFALLKITTMKKNLSFIAVWIFWILIVYSCTAFINLEIDLTKWIWQHRAANVLFGLVLGGWIAYANAYLVNE